MLTELRRCIPIASLVTPATLSVQSTLTKNSSLLHVPQYDFMTLNYVNSMPQVVGFNNWSRGYSFSGPSQPVQRIANAVAGLGEVLPIKPPASNTSWSLDMYGPTLQCKEVEGEQKTRIWTNVWISLGLGQARNCDGTLAYLGWIPCAEDPSLPFQIAKGNSTPTASFCGDIDRWTGWNVGPLGFYIATMPSLADLSFGSDFHNTSCGLSFPGNQPECFISQPKEMQGLCNCDYKSTNDLNQPTPNDRHCPGYKPIDFFKDGTIIQCEYMNTSYSLDFAYPDGLQNVEFREGQEPPEPITASGQTVAGPAYINVPDHYPGSDPNCSILSWTAPAFGTIPKPWVNCTFDPWVARELTYQGIISAFNNIVTGLGASLGDLQLDILNTVLANTAELAYLRRGDPAGPLDLQTQIEIGTQWSFQGLVNSMSSRGRGELRRALEDLFLNITISLLAEPYLQSVSHSQSDLN